MDIEKVAKAIEADAGEPLPDLRQALAEADAVGRSRTWNYRVIETVHDGQICRAIHEVHYENGKPVAYVENAAGVAWETDDGEPRRVLDRMREALDKPVLRPADFQK
jgi:hypothetical protein